MAMAVDQARHQRHIAERDRLAIVRQVRLVADCRDRVPLELHECAMAHTLPIGGPDAVGGNNRRCHRLPLPYNFHSPLIRDARSIARKRAGPPREYI